MNDSTLTKNLAHLVSSTRRSALDRLDGLPSWVVLTELFIGLGWLRAVAEKLIEPAWWRGDVLEQFIADRTDMTLGWYGPFLATVVLPLAPLAAVIVVVGQLVAGVSLVTGRRLTVGLTVGMFLNLHFMAAGAVTPSAFYLLGQGALALWLCERAVSRSRARALRVAAGVAAFAVGVNIPFISTLHPAHVIEDPAIMFAFGGALATLTCLLAASNHTAHASPRAVATHAQQRRL